MSSDANYGNFNATMFSNANDIDVLFKSFGFDGFVSWFNSNIQNTSPWKHDYLKHTTSYNIDKQNWKIFWSNIPLLFQKNSINLIEFLCLNSIVINETGGSFLSKIESVNSATNKTAPGIAYEFNGDFGKASYNTIAGNLTAYQCFHDTNYIQAHGTKGLSNILKNTTNTAWSGTSFPIGFSGLNAADEVSGNGKANGFLIEADFFKFRGRGYIQLTSRANYKEMVKFILSYSGNDSSVINVKNGWKKYGSNLDIILTCSQNSDWDNLFLNKNYSLALWSVGNYLSKHYRKPFPINADATPASLKSSIVNFGASISGGGVNGAYPQLFYERVIIQLNLINNYVPTPTAMPSFAANPTEQTKQEESRLERTGQDPMTQTAVSGQLASLSNLFQPTGKPTPISFDVNA
jgi:hypothetical protein